MFMGGLLLVMAGLLVLHRSPRVSIGRGLTVAAAVLAGCGVAASATAFALAGTAKYTGTTGWVIPALHDAASDQPVSYTPECTKSGFPVCIHPAFGGYLHGVAAGLQPAAAEIAGLPGAPARAEQVRSGVGPPPAAGTTSIYQYSGDGGMAVFWGDDANAAWWQQAFQQDFLSWFVSGPEAPNGPTFLTAAQQAVVTALMAEVGSAAPQFDQPDNSNGQPVGPSPAQVDAAARRLESLSSAARHAWLAAHIAEIRAGGVTLASIP
jgi:hypothetical protein